MASAQPLTPKEKNVLEFLENYIGDNGYSPTYQEIKDHFGFASFNSVQRYLKQLAGKGYIQSPQHNQKRAITVLRSASSMQKQTGQLKTRHRPSLLKPQIDDNAMMLPLLGQVAAGHPIEHMEHDEFVDVPPSFIRNADRTFALKVQGQSMIEDGIFDGDIILVQQQAYANNGEIVVAMTENEATVKRYYNHARSHRLKQATDAMNELAERGQTIELRPANASMQPMWFSEDQIEIMGVVVGLMRKFS